MTEAASTTLALVNGATGYTVKAVAARIMDMDIDAAGNAEKAAWKRYLSLCLLALAKGTDKATIVKAVFADGKASKTFHNMWTLANKCRGHVTGNMAWTDVAAMGIEDAFNATIQMINRHMAVHGVAGKNAYDDVCNMTVEEVALAKANAKAAKAEADKEAAEKEEADKAKAKEDEAKAKSEAADKAERTAADAAIAALHEAGKVDLQKVMYFILNQLDDEDLIGVRDQIEHALANAAKSANQTAETGTDLALAS